MLFKKKIFLFLYFLFTVTILIAQDKNGEDGVFKLIINKKEEMVEGKVIDNAPYIKKSDFITMFELENKDKKIIENTNTNNIDGVPYVNLEKEKEKLKLEKYEVDLENFIIEVKVPWKLSYEEEIEREKMRKRLQKSTEEAYEKEQWKLITPGILNVGYAKNDFSESDEYVYFNYVNNLFYGSTNIDGEIQKNKEDGERSKAEVNYAYWERDVLENKKLIVGDTYRRLPFNVGNKNEIIGYNVGKKNSWDSTMTVTEKYVQGYAPTGTMVELYENGILREYKIATSGEYKFKVDLYNGSREYKIKKYLSGGEVIEEKVTLGADEDILPKGEFDYYIENGQLKGQSEYKTYNAGFSYGAIDNLTLMLGGFNIYSEDNENSDFFMTGENGTFTLPYINAAIMHTVKVAKDNNNNMVYQYYTEMSKGDTSLVYRKDDYSELEESMRASTKKKDDVYISDKIGKTNIRVGTSRTEYDENSEEKEYYAYLYRTFYGNYLVNIGFSRREDLKNDEKENSILPSISYTLDRNSFMYRFMDSISLSTNIVEADTQYSLNISKNYNEWDYYLGYNIDNSGEWNTSFTLSWTPGKKAKIQTSIYSDNDGTKFGTFAETNVYLAGNKPQISYSDSTGTGSIDGKIYIDRDGNGKYEEGYDEIIPEAQIKTNGTEQDIKGDGFYALGAINTLSPEKVEVVVDSEFLPYNTSNKKERKVKLNPGGRANLDFGFVPTVMVVSNINFKNGFYIEEIEKLLSDFSIEFKNLDTNKVETYKWGKTDIFIKNLDVGEYAVNLIYTGNEKIKIYKSIYFLKLKDTEESMVDFEIEKIEENIFSLTVKHEGSQLATLYRNKDEVSLNKK